jgi:hypothetical protein
VTATLIRTGAGSAGPAVVQDLPGGTVAATTLALAQLPNPEYVGMLDVSAALAAPRDFHVVVTETQKGDYLHRPFSTGRATFFDVLEGDRLAELLG